MTDKSDELVWEAPPNAGRSHRERTGEMAERLAPLRDRPGEWAKVPNPTEGPNAANHAAQAIRGGEYQGIMVGEFEATTRMVDGQRLLWARYVGDDAERA